MTRQQTEFFFLNLGHFFDHFLILVFATVAALTLTQEWGIAYAGLIPYATPGFVAFGICALPAGWLADKWSREGMMVIFFVGAGSAALLAAWCDTPIQMAGCLCLLGAFAAIYHPVGLAMVVQGREKTGVPLAINGIFGNMGVACAALFTGFLIDAAGWRSAFIVPGALSIAFGIGYLLFLRANATPDTGPVHQKETAANNYISRAVLIKVFAVIFFTTAVGGLIFQATTFSLPKVFDERLTDIAGSATRIGVYAFVVFSVAAFAQLAVGYLVDNYSVRRVFAVVALLQAIFLGAMTQVTGVWAVITALAFMLAVFGQIPINDVLVGRMSGTRWRSRAFAARYIVTFSVSATAIPMIAWLVGSWGFGHLFMVLCMAAILIFVAALILPRTDPTADEETPLENAT